MKRSFQHNERIVSRQRTDLTIVYTKEWNGMIVLTQQNGMIVSTQRNMERKDRFNATEQNGTIVLSQRNGAEVKRQVNGN